MKSQKGASFSTTGQPPGQTVAFTLIELLVVVLIIAILASLPQTKVAGAAIVATTNKAAGFVPTDSKALHFQVVDADSSAPLPGVTIRLKTDFGALTNMGDPNQTGVTGKDGRLTVEVNIFGARRVEYWPQAQEDYSPMHGQLLENELRYARPILIKLQRYIAIGGLVAGLDGKPVEGAEILFNCSMSCFAGSPAAGSQKFDTVGGQRLAVTDRDGRWLSRIFPNNVSARTTVTAGNPEGIALPDLDLRIRHPDFADAVVSAATAATFVCRPQVIPAGSPAANAGGLDQERLQMAKGLLPASVVLSPGVSAGGKVVDATGAGVPGVEVRYGQAGRFWERGTVSGADGQFQIRHLPENAVSYVAIRANGYAPIVRAFRAGPAAGGAMKLDGPLQLEPGPGLTGRVLDLEGRPVSNVYIQFAGAPSSGTPVNPVNFPRFETTGLSADATLSDENGFFHLDSLSGNSWWLQFQKDGYITRREILSAGDHEIPLAPVLKLSGSVTDARTGKPVPRFRLSWDFGFECFNNPTHRYSSECADGAYALDLGEVKRDNRDYFHTVVLRVEAEGYPPVNSRLFVSGGAAGTLFHNGYRMDPPNPPGPIGDVGNVTCNFRLNSDDVTTGTVVDAQGHPAAGAQVAVVNLSHSIQLKLTGNPRFEPAPFPIPVTDDQGRFRIFVEPNPDFALAVHEKGFAFLPIHEFNSNSTIMLKPWCVVEGSAWDYDKPAVGRNINLYGASGQIIVRFSMPADNAGHFHFDFVPPGCCVLAGGTGPEFHPLLQPGENAAFQLGGTGRPVRGTVSSQDAGPRADWTGFDMARVAVPQPQGMSDSDIASAFYAGPRYAVQLSSDGSFRIEQLPPGKYALLLRESGRNLDSLNRIMNGISDLTGPFEVPAAASAVTREPLDVGVVKLLKVSLPRL
jgi:prepilin-type N-terminal cleavage/methylation domain-containing protein